MSIQILGKLWSVKKIQIFKAWIVMESDLSPEKSWKIDLPHFMMCIRGPHGDKHLSPSSTIVSYLTVPIHHSLKLSHKTACTILHFKIDNIKDMRAITIKLLCKMLLKSVQKCLKLKKCNVKAITFSCRVVSYIDRFDRKMETENFIALKENESGKFKILIEIQISLPQYFQYQQSGFPWTMVTPQLQY